MGGFLQKTLELLVGTEAVATKGLRANSPTRSRRVPTERELIQQESVVGAQIFGNVADGHRREFFNLDERTWIWYEEGIDPATNQKTATTIRYEVHENGILKVQEGARYSYIEGDELRNFAKAVQLYHEQVQQSVYVNVNSQQTSPFAIGVAS